MRTFTACKIGFSAPVAGTQTLRLRCFGDGEPLPPTPASQQEVVFPV